ncbi:MULTISPECIES: ATP-binding protein [Streptomyces]|uniref:ATP-binding protein n=1 Tax=Streptomyces luteosporeus TaxID=173856 RepID=A0ABP6GFK3_9ACTN
MKRRTAHWAGAHGRGGRQGAAEEGTEGISEGAGEESGPTWERRLRPHELGAVREIRAGLRALLAGRAGSELARTAELLASELVTNALVHTDGAAVFTARLTGGRLHVAVRDFLSRPPVAVADPAAWTADASPGSGPLATSGRGLLLVDCLADAWGVRRHAVGKAVWFVLDPALHAKEP